MTDWITEHDGSRWLSEEAAKEVIGALKGMMKWFGKYPEFIPDPQYAEETNNSIKSARALLARIGAGV